METLNHVKIHPFTGTDYSRPLYVSPSGRGFYPMGGGSEDDVAATAAKVEEEAKAGADKEAADAKAKAEAFAPPASQADLDRIIEARLARERAKFADYDEVKERAKQFDALAAASQTDQEKAVAAAREEERAKVSAEATPRVVKAEFKAAAKGVLTDEALSALIEDLDLTKYVTGTGDVDEEKVAKKIAALAPANGGNTSHLPRDLGQGRRKAAQGEKSVASGRTLYEQRHGKRTNV